MNKEGADEENARTYNNGQQPGPSAVINVGQFSEAGFK